MEDQDIGKWLDQELKKLSESDVKRVAEAELAKLKDFVSPDIYSYLSSDSSSNSMQQKDQVTVHASTQGLNSEVPNNRFGKPITDSELSTVIEKRIPANTKKSTGWGLNVLRDWFECRGVEESIESMPESVINDLLARFVQEVKRRDGKDYPASSLNNIVAAIQRYLRENGRPEVNFYDKNNPAYDLLRKSLDARMKGLTKLGVGAVKRQAQPISASMENTLWEKGIFSLETSRGLLNVVFWYACKLFGLRAADEHKNLEVHQFIIGDDETGHYLRFVGKSCKNWQGGLNQRKVEAKDLRIYSDPSLGNRCAISCFEIYLNLIPSSGQFYLRPIGDNPPRFSSQKIGIHKLENIVKDFCTQAGFKGFFTNHSGKVTCATELFKHNVDEQLIMRQTGHRSTDAVRRYKRPSGEHQLLVSKILQPPPPKKAAVKPEREPLEEVCKENCSPTRTSAVKPEREPLEEVCKENCCPTRTSSKNPTDKCITFTSDGSSTQNIYINF